MNDLNATCNVQRATKFCLRQFSLSSNLGVTEIQNTPCHIVLMITQYNFSFLLSQAIEVENSLVYLVIGLSDLGGELVACFAVLIEVIFPLVLLI